MQHSPPSILNYYPERTGSFFNNYSRPYPSLNCDGYNYRERFGHTYIFRPSVSFRTGFVFNRIRTMLYFDYVDQATDMIGLEVGVDIWGGKKKVLQDR